ncbi:response regulator transcription factor [Polymorphospora rubra]|uniref:Sensory transduction protein RegX3 n=1 Tax=Polymorphospora rubra TaxID=338584 RepID=A0A810NAU3_9ACTN|nr:response regulator transcription factor [Polymorphospora rubra]BCJ69514.1 DNA-binding response regulator [Polymorphospora rubra]
MKLLIVEDDSRVMGALRAVLVQHGLEVACARTGEQALELVADGPDAVLLDLGLPDQDGFKVCTQIRKMSNVPIIVVTARTDWRSRVHGLNLGADDCIVKPYNVAELVARIHAVTRRAGTATWPGGVAPTSTAGAGPHVFGPVSLNTESRVVMVDGQRIHLTVKEFDLLALLARRPGVVFRREQIMSGVWGTAWEGAGRTLEVHVASLRQKLAVPGLIETVRGVGYRLTHPVVPTEVA